MIINLSTHGFSLSRENNRVGNGNPLKYSCLENSMDWETWWTTVHGISKSQTRLSTHTQRQQTFCDPFMVSWTLEVKEGQFLTGVANQSGWGTWSGEETEQGRRPWSVRTHKLGLIEQTHEATPFFSVFFFNFYKYTYIYSFLDSCPIWPLQSTKQGFLCYRVSLY